MSISILFSTAIYAILDGGFERQIQIFSLRYYQLEYQLPNVSAYPLPESLELAYLHQAEDKLKLTLIYINLIILSLSGAISYLLAGKTLEPIQDMVSKQHQFIADASHELRTPITALKSQFEVFLRGKKHLSKDIRILIQSSLEEVHNLKNLSDGLLELSSYQESDTSMLFDHLHIRKIIHEAINKIKPISQKKNIALLDKTESLLVKGEEQSLIQLFVIILDNAVKYSHNNSSVFINVSSNDRFVSVSITDKGIGIDKKFLPYIFDRFYRADISRTKQHAEGYGLGLSIAKRIAQINKAYINVKSDLNKGTTFTVQLQKG